MQSRPVIHAAAPTQGPEVKHLLDYVPGGKVLWGVLGTLFPLHFPISVELSGVSTFRPTGPPNLKTQGLGSVYELAC